MKLDHKPFVGSSEQTLDKANRVVIPVSFRDALKGTFYLCRGLNKHCVWILPEKTFLALMENAEEQLSWIEDLKQNWIGRITSTAAERTMDSQHRVSIPSELLEMAGIKEKVKLIGHFSRIEIWDPDKWRETEESRDFYDHTAEISREHKIIPQAGSRG